MSEVVWKKLEEVVDIYTGEQLNKDSMQKAGQYPVMNGGTSYSGYTEEYNEERNTVTISQGGASAGFVNWLDTEFWLGAHCYAVKPKKNVDLSKRFLYHFLKNNEYILMQKKQGAGIPGLNRSSISNINFHYISPESQQAIVNQLDTFTSLISRLESELELRQKQYEHYREELLSFKGDEEVEWKTLGDIGDVAMCKRIFKEQTQPQGEIPFYKIGTFGKTADAFISRELYEDFRSKYKYPKIGDILMSASGSIGRTVVYDGSDAYYQDSNIVWIENDESIVSNKFLRLIYSITKWNVDNGGVIARLYNKNIRSTIIPIPRKNRQQQIVDKLDMFEQLIAALKREIALRKKQYTYYREKLLTFE